MDPKSNFSYLEKLLNDHYSESDLILLPEMFTSGFTMVPYNLPESNYVESKVWLANISTKYKSSIAGSVVCKIENAFFNRLILFNNELGEWTTPIVADFNNVSVNSKIAGLSRVVLPIRTDHSLEESEMEDTVVIAQDEEKEFSKYKKSFSLMLENRSQSQI